MYDAITVSRNLWRRLKNKNFNKFICLFTIHIIKYRRIWWVGISKEYCQENMGHSHRS
jgi:hypothetical protein